MKFKGNTNKHFLYLHPTNHNVLHFNEFGDCLYPGQRHIWVTTNNIGTNSRFCGIFTSALTFLRACGRFEELCGARYLIVLNFAGAPSTVEAPGRTK
jgi:hypothetical protein